MNKEEYLKIIQKEIKKINTDEKEDILSEVDHLKNLFCSLPIK